MIKLCKRCNSVKNVIRYRKTPQGGKSFVICGLCQKQHDKKYRESHKEYFKKYNSTEERKNKNNIRRKERLKTDLDYKAKQNLRSRLSNALIAQNVKSKSCRTLDLLGCDIVYFKRYLESKFDEYMAWENYGSGKCKWHIDHIKPCDSFDLTKCEEQRKCFHYTNLQPLWQTENLSKSKKYF